MMVVPVHEATDKRPRITQSHEAFWERWLVFHCLVKRAFG